jgi:hypothetical protein
MPPFAGYRRDDSRRVHLAHSAAEAIGYVNIPGAINGNAGRRGEPGSRGWAVVAGDAGNSAACERADGSIRGHLAHPAVEMIADVEVAGAVYR